MSGIDAFCEAILLQAPMVLENTRLLIDVEELLPYALYRMAWRHKYGANLASRFWCMFLRPRLAPKLHAEVDRAYAYAQKSQRAAFLDAILERGDQ